MAIEQGAFYIINTLYSPYRYYSSNVLSTMLHQRSFRQTYSVRCSFF